jgi:hypothetical protein
MHDAQSKEPSSSEMPGNGLGALVRIGWLAVGTIAILGLAMSIASRPPWSLGIRDALFWGATVGTAALRCIDVMKLEGQTTRGDPATTGDLVRYLVGLAVFATLLWLGAQSVQL